MSNGYRPKISKRTREYVYSRDRHKCTICGSAETLTLDHVIPILKGGKSTKENLTTMCYTCNSAKGHKTYSKFIADMGTLIEIKKAIHNEKN